MKISILNKFDSLSENTTIENQTNLTDLCLIPQTFVNPYDFYECYKYFSSRNITATFFEISLAVGTVFFNSLVVICMFYGSKKKTCFDKILFGYCLVDGVTGLIDMPFYHCNDIFGYWPFGDVLARLWSTYDNNININTSAHMLYASYARLRSIQNPKGYQREFMLKRPYHFMAIIWVFSLALWASIVNGFGIIQYTNNTNFNPFYWTTITNLLWFFLLFSILVVAIIIYVFLYQRAQKGKKYHNKGTKSTTAQFSITNQYSLATAQTSLNTSSNKTSTIKANTIKSLKRFRIPPEKKFLIIMGSYWIQWTPPCIMVLISPFIYINPQVYTAIYWLTYTVCITDPICVLTLNPNITFPRFKIFSKK